MMVRNGYFRSTALTLSLLMSPLAWPAAAFADDGHLVEKGDVTNRLLDAAQTRSDRVALFENALATPQAEARARSMGLDPARLRAVVPQLSDAELKDLASRASRSRDLAAGYYGRDEGLIILGIVLVLLLAIVLVASTQSRY